MNHDAIFPPGVEPGGLYSSQEIKILICYMLAGVDEPLPRQSVLEIIAAGGMANFFEAGAAIDELIRLHNLTEGEDGRLYLTEDGRQARLHPVRYDSLHPAGAFRPGGPQAADPDAPGKGEPSDGEKAGTRPAGPPAKSRMRASLFSPFPCGWRTISRRD